MSKNCKKSTKNLAVCDELPVQYIAWKLKGKSVSVCCLC